MSRIPLTGAEKGHWFETTTAKRYDESTHWNGQNHISNATGSKWEHEALYRTAGGKYILHHWSQYCGSEESYETITNQEAAEWLVRNIQEAPELQGEIEALEVQ